MSTTVQTTGTGSVYIQNLGFTGNSIIATNENGSVNFVPNGTGVIGFGDVGFNNGAISTTLDNLDLVLSPNGAGVVKTDNLQLDGNTISTINVDGDLVLAPNGTGAVGVGTTSPSQKLHVDGYQTFYDSTLLPGQNTTGSDLVPSKIILGNEYGPQIRTRYPNGAYTDGVDLEFWTADQNTATDNSSSRLTIKGLSGYVGIGTSTPDRDFVISKSSTPYIKLVNTSNNNTLMLGAASGSLGTILYSRQTDNTTPSMFSIDQGSLGSNFVLDTSGNVGIGTSSPSANLDVSGLIKADHLSLGTHLYPTLGGSWLTIYAPTFDGYIGDNAPNTEGGILFSNASSSGGFPWGFYMGTVKYSSGTNFTTTRLDIGTSTNLASQSTTGSWANTLSPKMSIDAYGNVGIGNSNPSYKLDVSGDFRCARFFTGDYGYWKRIYVDGTTAAGEARLYFINASNLNTYLYATGFTTFSDDRLKEEEEYVTNGLEICNKLSPQIYLKKNTLSSTDRTLWKRESGFIAQEIYYNVPELRHVVSYGQGIQPEEDIISSSQPNVDPDYSSWGDDIAAINYTEIIPYTVSAIQELSKNQTADNERILELEGEVSFLKEENNLLKQQLDSIVARLSAAGL